MKLRFVAIALSVCSFSNAAEIGVVEEIVAKVNGDIVTRSEIERGRRQLEGELKQSGLSGAALQAEIAKREGAILQERIDQLLLLHKGREMSINVDSEVSKYVAEVQLGSKIAEPEKFQQFIREQTGQPYEDWRNEIKNAFMTRRVVQQEVGGEIKIPRAELQKYYEEHKGDYLREDRVFLREILISTEGKEDKQIVDAERRAKEIAARAKKGERFTDLAKQYSDAPTKERMGELGSFKRDELNPLIAKAVFDGERGHVTDAIKLPNGYWIGRVDERHKQGQATFEEVENEIMEKLMMPRFQPRVREYLTKLRLESFLEIKDGYVDEGAAPGKVTKWTDPAQLKPETVTKEEVANQTRRRRLLWMVPIPGTEVSKDKKGVSSSR